MNESMVDEIEMQRRYYTETAHRYDAMHVCGLSGHSFALSFMVAALDYLQIRSILDVGSGTGRAVRHIKALRPELRIVGVEPVEALREIGYAQGLSKDDLVVGDAMTLPFGTGEFDLVCEFGALHHMKNPERAVSEMLRVAGKAVFISDSNNFGHGTRTSRAIKQMIDFCGLWKIADWIKTKGRGYTLSEGDGLAYSYSVFNNYKLLKRHCKSLHLLNTSDGHINPYKTASQVALLGIKK